MPVTVDFTESLQATQQGRKDFTQQIKLASPYDISLALGLPFWSNYIAQKASFTSLDRYGNACSAVGVTWVQLPSGLYAPSFEGTDDYVTCGALPTLDITGPMTIEAWINFSVSQAGKGIFDKWSAVNGYSWVLVTGTGGNANKLQVYFRQGGSGKTAITAATYNDGLWHHVFAFMDGANVLIEVDGVLATGQAITAIDSNPNTVVTIGGQGYGAYFQGTVGEAYIYNTALTLPQRQARRTLSRGNYGV